MNKKNKSGILILIMGAISIIVVTICAFNKEEITHKYYEYTVEKKYQSVPTNEYYLDDNFIYVENYTDTSIKNRDELINFIYFTLNSGTSYLERYIDKEYTNYNSDINILPSYLSKGLEFDSAIIYTEENNKYKEEEKYLYYVACTRAQHQLIIYNQN